jgi:hypothetical protein
MQYRNYCKNSCLYDTHACSINATKRLSGSGSQISAVLSAPSYEMTSGPGRHRPCGQSLPGKRRQVARRSGTARRLIRVLLNYREISDSRYWVGAGCEAAFRAGRTIQEEGMEKYRPATATMGILILSACGSSPPATSPGPDTAVPHQEIEVDTAITGATMPVDNESGLGTLASNGRDLVNCGRTRRTGSRIPREICEANAFNGLYPSGGMTMSTAKESGPRWGN